jgi:hypothetical protein
MERFQALVVSTAMPVDMAEQQPIATPLAQEYVVTIMSFDNNNAPGGPPLPSADQGAILLESLAYTVEGIRETGATIKGFDDDNRYH